MSDALSDVLTGFFKLSSKDQDMTNSTIGDLQGEQTALVARRRLARRRSLPGAARRQGLTFQP